MFCINVGVELHFELACKLDFCIIRSYFASSLVICSYGHFDRHRNKLLVTEFHTFPFHMWQLCEEVSMVCNVHIGNDYKVED